MFCNERNNMPETGLTMLKSEVRFSHYMQLLDSGTPVEKKQLTTAQLLELIRILLPKPDNNDTP